jgi:hypothetical protein
MNVQTTKRPDGFCYACEGYGYWHQRDFDMVPYGSTNVRMETMEVIVCPDCAEQGKCPQCGGELVDEDDTSVCLACGHEIDWEHSATHERDERDGEPDSDWWNDR